MSLKPQLEAIIYAAETPITLDQIIPLVKESVLAEAPDIDPAEIRSRVRAAIEELIADYAGPIHGVEIRQIAGGYRMSTKPEQHDVIRAFAKSLKSPSRLSMPALETLAVIAYRQPVTVPEINEIRGVDSGGVIATLLERKLITTSGRKAVIGRPILYKTSKDFLLRFGLKDIHELPSMEEFEKLLAESFQPDLLTSEAASSENAEAAPDSFEAEPASEIEGVPDNVISIKEHLRRASEDEGHQVEEISAAEETSPVEETSPGPKSSLEPESYTETQVHVEGDVRLENELRQHAEAPTGAEHK